MLAGTVTAEAALALVLGSGFKFKMKDLDGTVSDEEGEMTPLAIGAQGGGEFVFSMPEGRLLAGDYEILVSAFLKSQMRVGSFLWTIADVKVPIWQDRDRLIWRLN